jgi:hypothetical protein
MEKLTQAVLLCYNLQCSLLHERCWNLDMLTPDIFCNEFPKHVICCVCRNTAIKMVVQQEVHSPEIWKLHAVDLVTLVVFTHQLYERLCTQKGLEPRPFGRVSREKSNIAVRSFVARPGVHYAS